MFQALALVSSLTLAQVPTAPPETRETVLLEGKVLVSNSDEANSSLGFVVSPDGKMIALFNKEARRVRINDVTGTRSLLTLENRYPEEYVWSPDSSTLILREGLKERVRYTGTRIIFARPADQAVTEVNCEWFTHMVPTPDGRALGSNGRSLWLLSPKGMTLLVHRPGIMSIEDMTLREGTVFFKENKGLFAFELATPNEVRTVATFESGAGRGLYTPDGQTFYLNVYPHVLRANGGELRRLALPASLKSVEGLSASPDGKHLAIYGRERVVVVELSDSNKVVYEGTGALRTPRWMRDSSALWFSSGKQVTKVTVGSWAVSSMKASKPGFIDNADLLGTKPVFEVSQVIE